MLIVEDDEVIGRGMAEHLSAAGFDPIWVPRGELGLARLRYEQPDVCVLDLMLPGLDGWRLIETVRSEGIGTPIVVVSARGTEHDRVHALEIGADDYLVKPFSMKELVARVRAAARRGVRLAGDGARRADRDRGAEDRPARGAGLRRRRERRPHADGVPPALPARARPRPRRDARRAAAEAGAAARRTATARSTSSSGGCARRSTAGRRATRSSRRGTASATSSTRCRRKTRRRTSRHSPRRPSGRR